VDFQSFLRLLTAQLRNQDPLSPLDSTQFVAQLANFSTVEQLVSANARLDRLAEGLVQSDLASFSNWIGRVAEIIDTPVRFAGAAVPFRVTPRTDASEAQLVVRDESGAEVHRTQIGNSDAVQHWTGQGAQFGELYTLEVAYLLETGETTTGSVTTFDAISAIRTTESGPIFSLSSGLSARRDSIVGLGQ
jgi:flagellar basal-body rod modification protein FlgD